MERVTYARTGALRSTYAGLPVTKERLVTAAPAKWFPLLTTVPQRVLKSISDSDGVDGSLLGFLPIAFVFEELRKHLSDFTQHAAFLRAVLQWYHQTAGDTLESEIATDKVEIFQPYLPAYRLRVLKEGETVATFNDISRRAVTLMGKDRGINDIPLDHPSCSAQHAALEVNFVHRNSEPFQQRLHTLMQEEYRNINWSSPDEVGRLCAHALQLMREFGGDEDMWLMELQVVDLGSTNGTNLNGELLRPLERATVIEGDVLTFGYSTRKYLIVRA
ncbi:FHA domain containing protein [Trypanosoma brucei equiperdum]|uniref:FHA domain containing protein n=1 Tax=Trypanosoma brucei equiperdum TaxID=630700 RepID=A0A3L6LA19_9TRYP|nr:FHA domain containing protein [Trypanosoma brucei equiperdum]RHW73533.1 FHA domain containing protein [Trypanosoma brucei equiperdum]RHW73575.1 FHA domain containing protein [Trypanosoma brucei equiperdum]RHW73727.1 FHA domain containing protein [Trypanosoma brucei equiperdum]